MSQYVLCMASPFFLLQLFGAPSHVSSAIPPTHMYKALHPLAWPKPCILSSSVLPFPELLTSFILCSPPKILHAFQALEKLTLLPWICSSHVGLLVPPPYCLAGISKLHTLPASRCTRMQIWPPGQGALTMPRPQSRSTALCACGAMSPRPSSPAELQLLLGSMGRWGTRKEGALLTQPSSSTTHTWPSPSCRFWVIHFLLTPSVCYTVPVALTVTLFPVEKKWKRETRKWG